MIWLPLAFITALCESLKDVFGKLSLKTSNIYIVGLAYRLFSLPFILPLFFFIEIPEIKANFYLALIAGGFLNIIVTVLYMKALKHSDLSLTVPFLTFTPLFMLITSPVIVGEFPNKWGLMGVLLIVSGAYLMYFKPGRTAFNNPFKIILKEKGSRYMLLIAFIWSITANFDKMGIQNSSPMFWVLSISIFLTLGMFFLALFVARSELVQLRTHFKALLPVGLFSAASITTQMLAVSLTLVTYVISIKRTSALIGVLFGYFLFKEQGIRNRLIGTIIMILGVFLIGILG